MEYSRWHDVEIPNRNGEKRSTICQTAFRIIRLSAMSMNAFNILMHWENRSSTIESLLFFHRRINWFLAAKSLIFFDFSMKFERLSSQLTEASNFVATRKKNLSICYSMRDRQFDYKKDTSSSVRDSSFKYFCLFVCLCFCSDSQLNAVLHPI